MSKVVKGVKKGVKGIGKFVKKYWKPILAVAAIMFTGGLATIGMAGFKTAAAANGFWSTVGSTMWAGATSMAGSVGVGSGASGSAAAAAGMQGATLGTGAAAQSLGLAQAMPGAGAGASANVGQYTGPLSRAGGQAAATAAGGGGGGAGAAGGAGGGAGGGGLLSNMATAAAPALVQGVGGYFAARGQEKANEPKALWGVDFKTGERHQPAGFGQQQGGLLAQAPQQPVQYDQYGNPVDQFGNPIEPGHQRYMEGVYG